MIKRRGFVAGMIPTAAFLGTPSDQLMAQVEAQENPDHPYQTFSNSEADTLSAWCEVLVTGAAKAGVARFVDQNISGSFGDSMVLLRYLSDAKMSGFYQNGIAGIEQESKHIFAKGFTKLKDAQRQEIVEAAVQSKMQVWSAPNPNFFYFITRSDAVDVTYGTQAGFEQLGIPYLAHIEPPKPW